MKEFLKKIWEAIRKFFGSIGDAIRKFFKKLWLCIKSLPRKVWDWFVKLLYKIPFDKYLHFIAGLIIAAVAFICFGIPGCIFAALFAGILKEVFDLVTTNHAEAWDLIATCIGGAVIQICVFFSPLV